MSTKNKKFKVYVGDNFNFVDNSGFIHGEYDSFEDAVKACKKIVDDSLEELLNKNLNPSNDVSSPEKLYYFYQAFGADPYIVPPDNLSIEEYKFSAWDYAKERCKEIFKNNIISYEESG